MTFPNPNFDHQDLDIKVKKVINSHDQPLATMDPAMRDLRTKEGSIEILPHEVPWMQHMIIERMHSLEKEIKNLKESVDRNTAPNRTSAEEKLEELKKEDNYLRHNFAEKFFAKPSDVDTKVEPTP